MDEPVLFESNLILKEISPLEDVEAKIAGGKKVAVKQYLIRTELPDRGAGYSTAQLLAIFKREVLELKRDYRQELVGANLFIGGPLAAGMEGFFVDTISRNARNTHRQVGTTLEFIRMCGIDPDPDVQEAARVTLQVSQPLADALTSGYERAL